MVEHPGDGGNGRRWPPGMATATRNAQKRLLVGFFFWRNVFFLSGPGLNEGERDGIHKPCKTQRMV